MPQLLQATTLSCCCPMGSSRLGWAVPGRRSRERVRLGLGERKSSPWASTLPRRPRLIASPPRPPPASRSGQTPLEKWKPFCPTYAPLSTAHAHRHRPHRPRRPRRQASPASHRPPLQRPLVAATIRVSSAPTVSATTAELGPHTATATLVPTVTIVDAVTSRRHLRHPQITRQPLPRSPHRCHHSRRPLLHP